MPTIVSLKLRDDAYENGNLIPATYEDVDLDQLTPRARALAEAVARTSLSTAVDIWMEHSTPICDIDPSWRMWHTEEQAARPERRPWRGWARYPANSPVTPVEYLEGEARKIPPDWHVLGAVSPETPTT